MPQLPIMRYAVKVRSVVLPAAIAIAVLISAACTSHAAGGGASAPLTGTALGKRLLNASTVPQGLELQLDPVVDDSPSSTADEADPDTPCAELIDAVTVIRSAGVPAFTANVGVRSTASGSRWSATEWLYSFSGDGATKLFAGIRAIVDRCPDSTDAGASPGSLLADPSEAAKVTAAGPPTTHFSVVPGPALGDESVEVRSRIPGSAPGAEVASDAIVIRTGSIVLIVDELPTRLTQTPLHDLAAAAYARLQKS
jgi:hypothetical protein